MLEPSTTHNHLYKTSSGLIIPKLETMNSGKQDFRQNRSTRRDWQSTDLVTAQMTGSNRETANRITDFKILL
jgi:hypothetical protein